MEELLDFYYKVDTRYHTCPHKMLVIINRKTNRTQVYSTEFALFRDLYIPKEYKDSFEDIIKYIKEEKYKELGTMVKINDSFTLNKDCALEKLTNKNEFLNILSRYRQFTTDPLSRGIHEMIKKYKS